MTSRSCREAILQECAGDEVPPVLGLSLKLHYSITHVQEVVTKLRRAGELPPRRTARDRVLDCLRAAYPGRLTRKQIARKASIHSTYCYYVLRDLLATQEILVFLSGGGPVPAQYSIPATQEDAHASATTTVGN